jgi:hypothetical protein
MRGSKTYLMDNLEEVILKGSGEWPPSPSLQAIPCFVLFVFTYDIELSDLRIQLCTRRQDSLCLYTVIPLPNKI